MPDVSLGKLFTPLSVNGMEIRNRFVMPAMQRGLVRNSEPTDAMVEYLRGRAEGGVGIIISEGVGPPHPSAYWQDVICFFSPDRQEQWARIIKAVKAAGACFLLQIWHSGALREVAEGAPYADHPTISPSGLIQEARPHGRAATLEELEATKEAYVQAALDAQRLGADGVEIHACHGYFLDQFLWHETNLRDDHYGGKSLGERARYPAEIVAAVRAAVGEDFIISFRFSQWKEADYDARIAQTPEDLGDLLKAVRTAGADIFNVSARRFNKPEWPARDPALCIAGWAKRMTDAVVIAVGSVGLDKDVMQDLFDGQNPQERIARDLEDVARRLDADEFDLIAVGRAQIANADFVTKVREGRLDDIRLFDKSKHLTEFVEEWEVGAVAEFRKVSQEDEQAA